MPRRYYYGRRSYRGSRPRRKWAPTMVQGTLTYDIDAQTTAFNGSLLCQNSANVGSSVPVSTIVKVKNFKVVIDLTTVTGGATARNFFLALMYVPQGFTLTVNTAIQHPEWILVWRTIDATSGTSNGTALQNIQMSSRLARNLNSGDSIVLFSSAYNPSTGQIGVGLSFYCSFVTCNN